MYEYRDVIHEKYANNYDYNKAVFLMSNFQLLVAARRRSCICWDRVGLVVVDVEQRLQALARIVDRGRATDER